MTTINQEICTLCKKQRELDDKPPRFLIDLGVTAKKQIVVKACDHCDGAAVFLALRGKSE